MKKIGLVLSYKSTNYGAQLQAFATQAVIESLGYDTEILDYTPVRGDRHIVYSKGLLRYLYNWYRYKLLAKKYRESSDAVFNKEKKRRKEIEKDFIERRLHNIVQVKGYTKLAARGKEYDAVLVGSDQKWTPGFCYGNFTSLLFAPDEIRKISYATSLGVSEYPKYCWKTSRKVWEKIDYLSVREEQGAEIIRQVCGRDIRVQVVVDPTYLMTKEEWEDVFPVEKKLEENYVFCYFLGNDDNCRKVARQFADEKKMKLVSVLSTESFSEIDQSFADYTVKGNSPEDFVNWIRGAEYVLTDSFHGTAFSVINEKQFYIFYRKRAEATSRNSRIDNILQKWGLQDRLVPPGETEAKLLSTKIIDYTKVTARVLEEREKSLQFLKEALTFDDNK